MSKRSKDRLCDLCLLRDTLSELYPLKQVSWIFEFSILFAMFCLHFALGDDNRAGQNAAAAIFGFMFPSINLLIFPLVQG